MVEIKTIDITPTWTGMLHAMLTIVAQKAKKRVYKDEDVQTLKTVEEEFKKMAQAADEYVKLQKKCKEINSEEPQVVLRRVNQFLNDFKKGT